MSGSTCSNTSAGANTCESASDPCSTDDGGGSSIFSDAMIMVSIFFVIFVLFIPSFFLRMIVLTVPVFILSVISGDNKFIPRKWMPAG